MKDDIDETISLIQEIEKYPQLYDHNLAEYSNRRTAELNWTKIGKKFNETGKTKWKGIRSSYIRSLSAKGKSGSSAGSKKPYYLAKYLHFLNAFRKNYPQEGNLQSEPSTKEPENLDEESHEETGTHEAASTDSESRDRQISVDFDDLGESQYSFPDTPRAGHSTTDNTNQQADISSLSNPESLTLGRKLTGKRVKTSSYNTRGLNAADKCAIDYFTLKKKKAETVTTSSQQEKPNSCEMFLLSLVPQMESMTLRQQLSFQKGILELIENIKYPLQSDSGQQDLPKVTARSYYTSFDVGYKEQQTHPQDFTPAQPSYSHTHSQQTTHLQDLTGDAYPIYPNTHLQQTTHLQNLAPPQAHFRRLVNKETEAFFKNVHPDNKNDSNIARRGSRSNLYPETSDQNNTLSCSSSSECSFNENHFTNTENLINDSLENNCFLDNGFDSTHSGLSTSDNDIPNIENIAPSHNNQLSLHEEMQNWAVKFQISHAALKHFLTVIAPRIPGCENFPKDPRTYLDYAEQLLEHFVKSTKIIYGTHYLSHNFHNLLHIVDDVRNHGCLDNFSNFSSENHLQYIKNLLRKPSDVLSQIVKRINEIEKHLSLKNCNLLGAQNFEMENPHNDGVLVNDCGSPQFKRSLFTARVSTGNLPETEQDINILDEDTNSQLSESRLEPNNQNLDDSTYADEPPLMNVSSQNKTSELTSTPTINKLKRKNQNDTDVGAALIRLEEQKIRILEKEKKSQTLDEDDCFFDSLLPHIRSPHKEKCY
ncbi:unnamed protein product [Ceutorhynchus assimilis]|uniref:Transcription factor Adf-1 n=1 Tax=Ceutorhynchus assimilis TaxID=467358 RepID=A0A9N9MIW5_9CUCU|nr:unnamed protein product [Ceutorhynchus assimilis]